MSAKHRHQWLPESPLCFQWTERGVLAVGRCRDCGQREPHFTEEMLRYGASDPRWNTDNEGDRNVSPVTT